MAGRFRFLEDVALADAAFEASGDSPSELFVAAAQAVIETMVDPDTVSPVRQWQVEWTGESPADLLFDWLSQIVYYKDADGAVFRSATARVEPVAGQETWRLRGTLAGESIDPVRHALRADVKAVTKHLYEVSQDGNHWTARVVLDI